jgi:MtN3 and saliva related transmembrane protein
MAPLLEATGFVAALLTTFAFLPQVVQTWRSRSTAGLSLPTLVAMTAGIVLWLIYGLGTRQLPVVLANVVTLALVAVLLTLKLRDVRAQAGPLRLKRHPGLVRGPNSDQTLSS